MKTSTLLASGEMHSLWRAVDQQGSVIESYVTRIDDDAAAHTFMTEGARATAHLGRALRSYTAVMAEIGNAGKQGSFGLPPRF